MREAGPTPFVYAARSLVTMADPPALSGTKSTPLMALCFDRISAIAYQ